MPQTIEPKNRAAVASGELRHRSRAGVGRPGLQLAMKLDGSINLAESLCCLALFSARVRRQTKSDQPEDSMSMNRLKRRRISGISYKLRGGGQFRNLPRRVGPGCAHDLALCDASLPAGDTASSSAKRTPLDRRKTETRFARDECKHAIGVRSYMLNHKSISPQGFKAWPSAAGSGYPNAMSRSRYSLFPVACLAKREPPPR